MFNSRDKVYCADIEYVGGFIPLLDLSMITEVGFGCNLLLNYLMKLFAFITIYTKPLSIFPLMIEK